MTNKYNYKTTPYEHQREALIQGADENNFAYFMEMGTGKTKVAIDNACYLFQQKKVTHVIVVAPNSVYRNWIKEIKTHSPNNYFITMHKSRDVEFTDPRDSGLYWHLINVESFSRDAGVKSVADIIKNYGRSTMMILDESTTIKNRSAKRTKTLCKLGKLVQYKRILTGSPITKSPLDLYTQCEFLNPDLLVFGSYFTFRARYAVMQEVQANGRAMLFPKYYTNLDELEKKLKGFSYRVKKENCLDLPAKIYSMRSVQMLPEQKEDYLRLKKNAWAIIQDEEVSFANKLTEILRLHQVVNGFVGTDGGEIKEYKKCPKMKELHAVLEEVDGKVIIWANYIHNIQRIINELSTKYGKESVVSIYGAISTEDRQIAVNKFQCDSNVGLFVGNHSTGGYGLTLTEAKHVVYFSNNYNLEVRQQSEDRAHRIGQTSNVNYIDLICEKTIDEFVISALKKKIVISAETLGEQVSMWLK